MRGRYLLGVSCSEAPTLPPTDLESRFHGSGLAMSVSDDLDVHADCDDRYFVIGMMFPSPFGSPGFTPTQLVSRVWGGYIIVDATKGEEILLFRDPSAFFPAYFRMHNKTLIVSSDARCLFRAEERPGFDWTTLRDMLRFADCPGTATGIDGVSELLPGEILRFDRASGLTKREAIWTPWKKGVGSIRSFDEACSHLRQVADHTFSRWSQAYPKATASVSGGLDSSIVAASLAPRLDELGLFTIYTDDPAGDERKPASKLATSLGCALQTMRIDAHDIDIGRSTARHLPRPTGRIMAQTSDDFMVSLVQKGGLDCVFSGFGGDNVFCFLQSSAPLIDHWLCKGSLAGTLASFGNLMRLTGSSAAELGRSALMRWVRDRSGPWTHTWPLRTDFLLDPGTPADSGRNRHPWLEAGSEALPGQLAHVAGLLRTHWRLDRIPRSLGVVECCPLLSQPMVEACLSIASWLWCESGIDRAVARAAFRDRLPASVTRRSQKGSPVGAYAQTYELRRLALREMLVEGELARQGIIDAGAIDTYCSRAGPPTDPLFLRILELADVEAWIASWAR